MKLWHTEGNGGKWFEEQRKQKKDPLQYRLPFNGYVKGQSAWDISSQWSMKQEALSQDIPSRIQPCDGRTGNKFE